MMSRVACAHWNVCCDVCIVYFVEGGLRHILATGTECETMNGRHDKSRPVSEKDSVFMTYRELHVVSYTEIEKGPRPLTNYQLSLLIPKIPEYSEDRFLVPPRAGTARSPRSQSPCIDRLLVDNVVVVAVGTVPVEVQSQRREERRARACEVGLCRARFFNCWRGTGNKRDSRAAAWDSAAGQAGVLNDARPLSSVDVDDCDFDVDVVTVVDALRDGLEMVDSLDE